MSTIETDSPLTGRGGDHTLVGGEIQFNADRIGLKKRDKGMFTVRVFQKNNGGGYEATTHATATAPALQEELRSLGFKRCIFAIDWVSIQFVQKTVKHLQTIGPDKECRMRDFPWAEGLCRHRRMLKAAATTSRRRVV